MLTRMFTCMLIRILTYVDPYVDLYVHLYVDPYVYFVDISQRDDGHGAALQILYICTLIHKLGEDGGGVADGFECNLELFFPAFTT